MRRAKVGAELLIQRDHGVQSRRLHEKVQQSLNEVVWLHRTSRDIDDGDAGLGFPGPPQIVSCRPMQPVGLPSIA